MQAIHPCSCGATDVMPVLEHRADSHWHARVECDACERVGPERQSTDSEVAERLSIESWNLELHDEDEDSGDPTDPDSRAWNPAVFDDEPAGYR